MKKKLLLILTFISILIFVVMVYVFNDKAESNDRLDSMKLTSRVFEGDLEALLELKKGADKGNLEYIKALGDLYFIGQTVAKNCDEALKWYKLAAEQGDSNTQNKLGRLYFSGECVAKDYAKAYEWFNKSSEEEWSQASLGDMHFNGLGVKQDYEKAFKYYQKAISRSPSRDERYQIGFMYENGLGVPKNYEKAINYYFGSATFDYYLSYSKIGTIYYEGKLTDKDLVKAYAWFNLCEDKFGLPLVEKKLTKEQIIEAQQLSAKIKDNLNIKQRQFYSRVIHNNMSVDESFFFFD